MLQEACQYVFTNRGMYFWCSVLSLLLTWLVMKGLLIAVLLAEGYVRSATLTQSLISQAFASGNMQSIPSLPSLITSSTILRDLHAHNKCTVDPIKVRTALAFSHVMNL